MNRLRHVEVVIPARNEEARITDCLDSVRIAIQRLRSELRCMTAGVTVVVDCCTDDTASLASASSTRTVISDVGCVGAARHLGAVDAMRRLRRVGVPERQLWLANTDADSTVPDTWLLTQVLLGDSGNDAVIGTVTPAGLDEQANRLWHLKHRLEEGHDHVHGANLGMRASTYCEAGGFAPLSVHEDRDLVNRVKALTSQWIATHRTNVTTSARLESRVEGGFASYVATLAVGDASCV